VIWLKENIEAVHGLPYRKIAEIASAGVGFPITISNLHGAEKAGEMELPIASRVNPPAEKPKTRDERLTDLERRLIAIDLTAMDAKIDQLEDKYQLLKTTFSQVEEIAWKLYRLEGERAAARLAK
jgi:hypothetical protein